MRPIILIFARSTGAALTAAAVTWMAPVSMGAGADDTVTGSGALHADTSGNYNTADGFDALYHNTTGAYNTAVGANALLSITSGSQNIGLGVNALYANTTGANNAATGVNALYYNTTGSQNTADGHSALQHNTTATYNTADGYQALFSNTTGASNTAAGGNALYSNTAGYWNTSLGVDSLYTNGNGAYNTAIGVYALTSNDDGSNNVAVGVAALEDNAIGSQNIGIGVNAGYYCDTGNYNIYIGNEGNSGDNGVIYLGDSTYQGQTYIAGIAGTEVSGAPVVVDSDTGQLGVAGSSARFKDDIRDMNEASDLIYSLRPVSFRYKPSIDPHRRPEFGLVAEEVEKVNPELVVHGKDGKPFTVRYEQVNAMLLNEFLKAHHQLEEQQSAIRQMQTANIQLQAQVAALTDSVKEVNAKVGARSAVPVLLTDAP